MGRLKLTPTRSLLRKFAIFWAAENPNELYFLSSSVCFAVLFSYRILNYCCVMSKAITFEDLIASFCLIFCIRCVILDVVERVGELGSSGLSCFLSAVACKSVLALLFFFFVSFLIFSLLESLLESLVCGLRLDTAILSNLLNNYTPMLSSELDRLRLPPLTCTLNRESCTNLVLHS